MLNKAMFELQMMAIDLGKWSSGFSQIRNEITAVLKMILDVLIIPIIMVVVGVMIAIEIGKVAGARNSGNSDEMQKHGAKIGVLLVVEIVLAGYSAIIWGMIG